MSVSGRPATAGWSRSLALLVAASSFLENLDGTILTTAAPAIARDFVVDPAGVGIAMTAYLLAVAALLPVSAWLVDRLGARPVFLAAILVFTVGSLLSAVSPSLPLLTAARVVQGIGGSMMVPVGRLLVLRTTRKSDLLRAIAFLVWPALAAPVIAPLLGGVLTQYWGWPWIFLVNLPIGVVLLVLAWRVVPRGDALAPRPLDPLGLSLAIAAIVALVAGLELVPQPGSIAEGLAVVALSLVLFAAAVLRIRRARHPLVDLGAFAHPTFRIGNVAGTVFRITVSAVPFLAPLVLQDGFGWSPVTAGLMVTWVFVGNLAIKPATTPLIRLLGFRVVILGATIGLAATLAGAALLTPSTPPAVVAGLFLVSGAFRSIGFSGYMTVELAEIPQEGMNAANTLSSTITQLGAGLGVALSAVAVRAIGAVAGDPDGVVAYRGAFLVMSALAVASLVGPARLRGEALAEARGTRAPRGGAPGSARRPWARPRPARSGRSARSVPPARADYPGKDAKETP